MNNTPTPPPDKMSEAIRVSATASQRCEAFLKTISKWDGTK